MDSWTIALGILEAAAIVVGLFVAFAVSVRIGLVVLGGIAMLGQGVERSWSRMSNNSERFKVAVRFVTWPVRVIAFMFGLREDVP
jgi:hypothetical protein